ncbi:MAG: peptide ABC transporter substrate-binding protein [Planctomycetes bacterium]|nr:peptide ABC transporter substrate-binding protein [Planctomycetota bacterium]
MSRSGSQAGRSRVQRLLALALVLPVGLALLGLARRARLERADFVFNNGAEVTSLDPAAISGQAEGRVADALFEGLTVKHPQTLEALPGVAEAWELAPDGLTWTFHLRAARWSNGEPLTAEDFLYSWRRLLEPATAAPYAALLHCVRGAEAYAAASADEREARWAAVGLRASDARTLVVELARPTPYFLALTSFHPLFPVRRKSLEHFQERFPESWQSEWMRPGNLVSNGPYKLIERRVNDRLRLAKNPEYWDAANVALRSIDVLAVEHIGTGLNLYLAGDVDWIDRVPTALVPELRKRADFTPAPYLATYFYRVNVTQPPLDDRRVRRALALSIDRRALCERILQKGELPSWSVTPPSLPGYARAEMLHAGDDETALERDRAEARALLAEAGYGPQHPLPVLEILFNTSETHRDIAEVVAAGWTSALGLEVKLLNQEWKSYLDSQHNLRYQLSRSSWIGDYADANNFLEVFVGGGENNRTGWRNERYDGLVGEAARELEPARRATLLAQAEALLLEELPILPIYSYVSQNLVNPRLDGFFANVQDTHPPKFWRWKRPAPSATEPDAPAPERRGKKRAR